MTPIENPGRAMVITIMIMTGALAMLIAVMLGALTVRVADLADARKECLAKGGRFLAAPTASLCYANPE